MQVVNLSVAVLICQHLVIFSVGDFLYYTPLQPLGGPRTPFQYLTQQLNLSLQSSDPSQQSNVPRNPFLPFQQPNPFQQFPLPFQQVNQPVQQFPPFQQNVPQSPQPFQQVNLPSHQFPPSQQNVPQSPQPFQQPNLPQDLSSATQRLFPQSQHPTPGQQPFSPYQQPTAHNQQFPPNSPQQPFSPFQQLNSPQQPFSPSPQLNVPQQPFLVYQPPSTLLQQPYTPMFQRYQLQSYFPYQTTYPLPLLQQSQQQFYQQHQLSTCPLPAPKCANGQQAVCERNAFTGQSAYKCPIQDAERGIPEVSSVTPVTVIPGMDDASRDVGSEPKEAKRSLLESLLPVSQPPVGHTTTSTEESHLPRLSQTFNPNEPSQSSYSPACSLKSSLASCPSGLCCILFWLFQARTGQVCQPGYVGCQPNIAIPQRSIYSVGPPGSFPANGAPLGSAGVYPVSPGSVTAFGGSPGIHPVYPGSASALGGPQVIHSSLGSPPLFSGNQLGFPAVGPLTLPPAPQPPPGPQNYQWASLNPPFSQPRPQTIPGTISANQQDVDTEPKSALSKIVDFVQSILPGGSDQDQVNHIPNPNQYQPPSPLIRPGLQQPDQNAQPSHPQPWHPNLQNLLAQMNQYQPHSPLIGPGFPQQPHQSVQQGYPLSWNPNLQNPLAPNNQYQPQSTSIHAGYPQQPQQNVQQGHPQSWNPYLSNPLTQNYQKQPIGPLNGPDLPQQHYQNIPQVHPILWNPSQQNPLGHHYQNQPHNPSVNRGFLQQPFPNVQRVPPMSSRPNLPQYPFSQVQNMPRRTQGPQLFEPPQGQGNRFTKTPIQPGTTTTQAITIPPQQPPRNQKPQNRLVPSGLSLLQLSEEEPDKKAGRSIIDEVKSSKKKSKHPGKPSPSQRNHVDETTSGGLLSWL